jgi:RND family efflux transporter MFP subunit
MSSQPSDLSVLARASAAPAKAAAGASVPVPPSRWRTRVLLPWAVIGAVVALLAYAARDTLLPATPVRVVPVVLRTATDGAGGPGTFSVQAPGWVEPDPYAVAVTALADGVVEEVLVLEGQPVKKGDVVARMVADDARISLARAEAAVLEREGELKQAEAVREAALRDWENPIERTRAVAFGEAMLAECMAMHEQVGSQVAAEAARVVELEDMLRRTEKSVPTNAASESELVQAKAKLDAQRAVLVTTKANEPVLAAKVRQQQADLDAARKNAKLRIPERRAVAESEAAVLKSRAALDQAKVARDEAKLRLSRMEIRSPADGVVMSRHVEPGSTMMLNTDNPASAHTVRLYDPKRLQVRVDVPLADAAKVSVGQKAKVVVGVLPDRTFDGEITRVVPQADIQRNTLQVKVRITNPAPELRPEMLARVRFADALAGSKPATTSSSQQVFIPESMLKTQPDGTAEVWVVDRGRGVADVRTITLGDGRAGGWVAVREGLQPGDQLIAGDTSTLSPGHRVRIVGEADAPEVPNEAKGDSHGAH